MLEEDVGGPNLHHKLRILILCDRMDILTCGFVGRSMLQLVGPKIDRGSIPRGTTIFYIVSKM